MKRARFSEEQIIGILKAAEAVGNIRQACRFYRWRRKFSGMEVSDYTPDASPWPIRFCGIVFVCKRVFPRSMCRQYATPGSAAKTPRVSPG